MSFVTPTFVVFLATVLALYLPLGRRLQNGLLLVASAVFYGWEHAWYVGLLYAAALLDFGAALGMEQWPARKRALLVASVSCNLALLGWFKYAGFFALNLRALGAGISAPDVLLPAGISFYTFQTLSYTIDVYRGRLRPCRNPLDYLLFVSLFPQLVAGPIERAGDLLAQVEAPRKVTAEGVGSGLMLALWGATKKLVIADNVAIYVDRVYGLPVPSLPLALAGAFAFSVQILADFSGYTDIARGVARMLGFRLQPNFLHPYLAASPTEFWRRWHVSFSTWIRDYLYIPLGGSRGGALRVALVTLATMGISGLWHGASWNFALWGLFHGALIVIYRPLGPAVARLPRALTVPVFFALTVVGWGIFRQHDTHALLSTLRQPWPDDARAEGVVAAVVVTVGALGGAVLVLGLIVERHVLPQLGRWRVAAGMGFASCVGALLLFWSRDTPDAFIYFRF